MKSESVREDGNVTSLKAMLHVNDSVMGTVLGIGVGVGVGVGVYVGVGVAAGSAEL